MPWVVRVTRLGHQIFGPSSRSMAGTRMARMRKVSKQQADAHGEAELVERVDGLGHQDGEGSGEDDAG